MATYNQMLDEDSQVIESSFDDSYDSSSYVPETPPSPRSSPQTVPQSSSLTIPYSDNDLETEMEIDISAAYSRSIVSMEVSYVSDYNQAQPSLMDVSYDTTTTSNFTGKYKIGRPKVEIIYFWCD